MCDVIVKIVGRCVVCYYDDCVVVGDIYVGVGFYYC